MAKMIICNACEAEFDLSEPLHGKIKNAGVIVEYFSCPSCGARYQIFTTDEKMRELITKRKKLQHKIATARQRKFRESTIKGYIEELDKISKEQRELFPKLKKQGDNLIATSGLITKEGGKDGSSSEERD